MSVARGLGLNGRALYSNIAKPCEINLQFTVEAANSGGLGVTSIKSNGYVEKVFMHTSATPGGGNPNPAAGNVLIQLKQNFNVFLYAESRIQSPLTGTNVAVNGSALTVGDLYVITAVGTSTAADWTALGVPAGVTPAVGVAFVALLAGHGSGSGQVQLASVSGITNFEVIAANQTSNIAANAGTWIYGQFLGATSSTSTVLIPTNPADGSIVEMKLYFDGSSVTVDGL